MSPSLITHIDSSRKLTISPTVCLLCEKSFFHAQGPAAPSGQPRATGKVARRAGHAQASGRSPRVLSPLTSHVTLDKALRLSEPQFLPL